MKQKTLLFYFFIFSSSTNIYCQDRIIFVSGKERKCTIINEDSAFVNVIFQNSDKNLSSSIDRKYITSIVYSKPINKEVKLTYLNDETINCTLIHEDSISISINVLDNGLEKTLYINKNSIKSLETDDLSSLKTVMQRNRSKTNDIYFYLGPSFPIDFSEGKSGYLGLGGNVSFNLSIGLNPYFNFGIKAYTLLNKTESYSKTSLWKSAGFLGGLELILPIKKLDFHLRCLGGYMYLESPEFEYKLSSSVIEFKRSSSNAFGYNIGIGLDFKNSETTYFLMNLEFLHGNFVFNDAFAKHTLTYTSSNITPVKPVIDGVPSIPKVEYTNIKVVYESKNQVLNTINFNIGIGFNF